MSAQVESSLRNLATAQGVESLGVESLGDADEPSEQQQAVPESALKALDALRGSEDLYAVCSQLGVDVANKEGSEAYVQPRGLINTGNTCFLNSSAQVGAMALPSSR
jgi:hypothetical protein